MSAEALPLPETIGERIRYVREFIRRWQQKELAEETQQLGRPIPAYSIMRIEQGRKPTLNEALTLAEAMHVSLAQLGVSEGDYEEFRAIPDLEQFLSQIRRTRKRPSHLRLVTAPVL